MSELLLPRSVVEEMAEERAADMVHGARGYASARAADAVEFVQPGFSGALGFGSDTRIEKLLQEGSVGWPAIANTAIANRLASLRFMPVVEVEGEGGEPEKEHLADHLLQGVLDKPGPIFSRFLLQWITGWHVMSAGVAYHQVLHDAIGVPRELWPMPPERVRPVAGPDNLIDHYIVTAATGQQIRLEAFEVVRIWRPDPKNMFAGMGALMPQSVEHDAERFLMEHVRAHFETDATPRVALKAMGTTQPPKDPYKSAWEDDWRRSQNRRRGSKRGIPVYLPPGFDVHEFDREDGQHLVPLAEYLQTQLLAGHGVPGSIVGMVVDVNRAAAETNKFVFDSNTMLPLATLVADAWTQQLASQVDARITIEPEEFVAPDKDFDLQQEESDLKNKVRSPQQVRRARGWAAEDAPWGELPVGSIADAPYTGEVPDDDGVEVPEDLRALIARAVGEALADRIDGAALPMRSTDRIARACTPDEGWARVLATEKKWTGRWAKATLSVFEQQRRAVIRDLGTLVLPRSGGARIDVSDIFRGAEWVALFRRLIDPIRRQIYTDAGTRVALDLGAETFTLTDLMVRFLEQRAAEHVVRINATTKRRLARILREGVANGDSITAMTPRINAVMLNRKRARTIARTEVGAASQSGQLQSMVQGGVATAKRWHTSRDGDPRHPSREGLEGQTVPLAEKFDLGNGARAMHPLDPSLPAEELVNCRCFVLPVVAEDDDAT